MNAILIALLLGTAGQVGSSSTSTKARFIPRKPKTAPVRASPPPRRKATPRKRPVEPPPPAKTVPPPPKRTAAPPPPVVVRPPPPKTAPSFDVGPPWIPSQPTEIVQRWFVADWPRLERLRTAEGTVVLLILFLVLVVATALSSTFARQLTERRLFSRLAFGLSKTFRIGAGLVVLLLVTAWLPVDTLPFLLLALALGLGWSMRDIFPDLIAGTVLAFERRVKVGMWLSGDGFAGVVERVGFRATWLRDASQRRIVVPNRSLVSAPIKSEDGRFPTREVSLRVETSAPAEKIRQAIVDAVITSPWTPVSTAPIVRRDGADPHLWNVRAQVLALAFASEFEGELLERTEEMLSPPEQ